jgi:hypothetical protein
LEWCSQKIGSSPAVEGFDINPILNGSMKSLSRAPPMSPWTLSCGLCSSSPSSPRPLCLNGVRPPPKPGEPPICVPTKLSSRNAASSETDRGSSVIGPPDCPVDPYRATTKSGLVPPSGHVCDPKAGGRWSRLGLLSSL